MEQNKALSINVGLPDGNEWDILQKISLIGVQSGLLPQSIKTKEQALIIALKAREIGVPTMQGFSHINVINGKPAISSELMLSLIYRNVPGSVINYLQTDDVACVIEAKRPNGKLCVFKFTIEDAEKAQLTNKDNWKKFKPAMLRARAISAMARAMFPDALMGCSYTPEELNPDGIVSEDGDYTEKEVNPVEQPAQIEKPKVDQNEILDKLKESLKKEFVETVKTKWEKTHKSGRIGDETFQLGLEYIAEKMDELEQQQKQDHPENQSLVFSQVVAMVIDGDSKDKISEKIEREFKNGNLSLKGKEFVESLNSGKTHVSVKFEDWVNE